MPQITQVALHFPEKTFTKEDFFQRFPGERESKTWDKLGIETRHLIGDDEIASDLGFKAAEKLLDAHPQLRDEIDFIIFSAGELDHYTPTTAGILQDRLKISNYCGCIDVQQGCSGFPFFLSHALGMISLGAAKKVLIITVSALTRQIHEGDKANRYIFGDAAAAVIVEASPSGKFHTFRFGNDGAKKDRIIIKDGAYRNPISESSYLPFENAFGEQQIPAHFYQDGAGVFRFTLDRVPKMIDSMLEENNYTREDIDLYLLHQPNAFIVKSLTRIAKLPAEKVVLDVKDYGNTVSSSIPILIHNLQKKNKIKPGMKILIAAFGTGLSWSGCIWET
jgi:3-oxoacyl-[acyl-carrier-protein] synthase-3